MSGGGGWGKKQGLLALDSEVRFDPSGDEEMHTLVQSLDVGAKPSDEGQTPSDAVQPGYFVQFFITPAESARPAWAEGVQGKTSAVFGVASNQEDEPNATVTGNTKELIPGLFGGLSTRLYVDGDGSDESVPTKINIPHARLFART